MLSLINSDDMLKESFDPKYDVDNKDSTTFKNKTDTWTDYMVWLNYIMNNQTKNKHFDPITYMFGIIQQVEIVCKQPGSTHINKVISRKYLIEPYIKIEIVPTTQKSFESMQELLDEYFGLNKNPVTINGYKPCDPSAQYTNIIPCGKYILINIVNYTTNLDGSVNDKDTQFKITPPPQPAPFLNFLDKTLQITINGKIYRLRSMILHIGANIGGGHYINIKNLDAVGNNWKYISDTTVTHMTIPQVRDYFTSPNAWTNTTPVIFMYELVDDVDFYMKTIDTYNTDWFDTNNWKTQKTFNTSGNAVGFNNSVNGCFFNATMQLLYANRHLATLILNSDSYDGIDSGPAVPVLPAPLSSSPGTTVSVSSALTATGSGRINDCANVTAEGSLTVGYDFDGVLHKSMARNSQQPKDNIYDYYINGTTILDFAQRHPNHTSKAAYLTPHKLILDSIRAHYKAGNTIHIISSNISVDKVNKYLLLHDIIIPVANIHMPVSNKEVKAEQLNIDIFIDDSCKHIKQLFDYKKSGNLNSLKRLFYCMPEYNNVVEVDLSKPSLCADPIILNNLWVTKRPKTYKCISWNMRFDCTSYHGVNCYNNMINYINAKKPDIFCAQEASWFPPDNNPPQGVIISSTITLNGFISNIAWGGKKNLDNCLVYWNPDEFDIDPNYPLSPIYGTEAILEIDKGYVPKNSISGKYAIFNAWASGGGKSRPIVGVRLIAKNDSYKCYIIISVHLEHQGKVTSLIGYINQILEALDYQTAHRVILMGDFNELVEEADNKDKYVVLKCGDTSNPVYLSLSSNWYSNTHGTCCNPPGYMGRTFDLCYDSDNNFKTEVDSSNLVDNTSDHYPVISYLNTQYFKSDSDSPGTHPALPRTLAALISKSANTVYYEDQTLLTDSFRIIKGGIGGTTTNPIYYVTFHKSGKAAAQYFKVPIMHQYTILANTRNLYAFKIPVNRINSLPDYIKNRRNSAFSDEFFFVIQGINLNISGSGDPPGKVLFRPHYYYMGNSDTTDEDTNWANQSGNNFSVDYTAGVWVKDGTSITNYANNNNLSTSLPTINIHAHDTLISPNDPYINLNLANNDDYNKTIWSFVQGITSNASNGSQQIQFNKNKKNIITLHWIMDMSTFSNLRDKINDTTINNLQQLYDYGISSGLISGINNNNIRTALGI